MQCSRITPVMQCSSIYSSEVWSYIAVIATSLIPLVLARGSGPVRLHVLTYDTSSYTAYTCICTASALVISWFPKESCLMHIIKLHFALPKVLMIHAPSVR